MHTYQWDAKGRLKTVDNGALASFTYNALEQRIEKNLSNGHDYREYSYDPVYGEVYVVLSRITLLEDYFPPVGGKNYVKYQASATFFLHNNDLGSTDTVTDQMGGTIQDALFYPWGQRWAVQGSMWNEQFAGMQQRDSETGLDTTPAR